MNPKINIDNLVRQLVPPHRRQPVRLGILCGLLYPLRQLWEWFELWRDDIRLRINVNSQVMVLEGYLRNKYNDNRITIASSNDGLLWVGLVVEGDLYMPKFGLLGAGEQVIYVPLLWESGASGDVDFFVYIPEGVDIEVIRAEIERYRQAGVTYEIIQK